jgi:hypothetical protein
MMIIWWSKHVGVILSVLVCDIWINVFSQTDALVGPLYIVNWNARWNSEIPKINFTSTKIWTHRTLISLLHVSARPTCHRQGVLSVATAAPSKLCQLLRKWVKSRPHNCTRVRIFGWNTWMSTALISKHQRRYSLYWYMSSWWMLCFIAACMMMLTRLFPAFYVYACVVRS